MQICEQFYANPGVNPATGRQISIGGPAYRDLVSRCGIPPSLKSSRLMALPSTVSPCPPCPPCPSTTFQGQPSIPLQSAQTQPQTSPIQSMPVQSSIPLQTSSIQPWALSVPFQTSPIQSMPVQPSIPLQSIQAQSSVPFQSIQPRISPVSFQTSSITAQSALPSIVAAPEPATGELPLVVSQEVKNRCVSYEIGRADEDRYFAAHFGPVRFYGVFDGHGGPKTRSAPSNSVTANFLRDNFPQKFYSKLKQLNLNDQNQVRQAINETFLELDRELYERGDAAETGSTAGIALITPTRLYLINLGDSRSIVFDNQGRVILATEDNKPNDPPERARIESLGGSVNLYMGTYRVNNSLAVSRAFGDYGLKRSNRSAGYDPRGWVSIVPDIYMMDLPPIPRSLYLVMASDGLWDGFNPAEVARFLTERSMTGPNLCQELVQIARTRTTDDVTAMLIDL